MINFKTQRQIRLIRLISPSTDLNNHDEYAVSKRTLSFYQTNLATIAVPNQLPQCKRQLCHTLGNRDAKPSNCRPLEL